MGGAAVGVGRDGMQVSRLPLAVPSTGPQSELDCPAARGGIVKQRHPGT